MKQKNFTHELMRLAGVVCLFAYAASAFSYDFKAKCFENTLYFNIVGVNENGTNICEVTYSDVADNDGVAVYNQDNADYAGDIRIPDVVENEGVSYLVERIGDHAFQDSKIASISFVDYIKTIGYQAFKNCVSLTYFEPIHFQAMTIGDEAFVNCTSLETFIFWYYEHITVGSKAFYGCSGLISVTVYTDIQNIEVAEDTFDKDKLKDYELYIGDPQYKEVAPWKDFGKIIIVKEMPTGGENGINDAVREKTAETEIYTVGGMRVATGVQEKGKLPAGLYIKSGKKVLVK